MRRYSNSHHRQQRKKADSRGGRIAKRFLMTLKSIGNHNAQHREGGLFNDVRNAQGYLHKRMDSTHLPLLYINQRKVVSLVSARVSASVHAVTCHISLSLHKLKPLQNKSDKQTHRTGAPLQHGAGGGESMRAVDANLPPYN